MSCGTCSEKTKRGAAAAIGAPTATGAASPRLNAETLRYLAGPIIAHQDSEDEVPDWLRQAIPQARRELVESGEATLATEEEVCAYLMTASLAMPLDRDWAGAYIWIASRVCGKHSRLPQGQDFWAALGHDTPQSLNRKQESNLWKLREWLRRTAPKNGKAKAAGNGGSPGDSPRKTKSKAKQEGAI